MLLVLLTGYLLGCLLNLVTSQPAVPGEVVLRHGFRPPYINNLVPFWDYGAGAYINDTYIRVTPAKQSRTGYLWNNVLSLMVDWEVTLEFHVTGLRHIGGDGFAFWYVEKPELLGPVYGSADYWVGLGIFFDTFNNDGRGENPLISAVFNDGTQRFNHADDGAEQAMATCSFPFRNMGDNSFAKIRYQNNALTVSIALHRDSTGQPTFVNCLHVEDLVLGVDKYFGITAHTGDVADNHDVHTFTTRDLTSRTADIAAARQHFHDRIQYEHHREHHQELSQQDFQHEVLTLLNQIQEETNMLELSQVAIENTIHSMALGQQQDGQQVQQPQGGYQQQGVVTAHLSDIQSNQLQNTADNVYSALQKLENLRSQFMSLEMKIAQQGGGQGQQGQAAQAAFNPTPLVNELTNHIATADSRLLTELKNYFNDQVRKLTDTIRQTQNDQRQIQNQLSTVSEDLRGGGVGILFYVLLIANTIGVVVILLLNFKGSGDRRSKKFDL